jgi:uncharacterized OB-fold protein
VIEQFKAGEIRVLSSVGVLTTGFDATIASCLILARPTKSEILHFQMVGRVLRPHDGKDKALILDHAGNFMRLGFHTDDVPQELDDGKPKEKGQAGEKKEKLPIACPDCTALVEPGHKVCPACGHVFKKLSNVIETGGDLKRVMSAMELRNAQETDSSKGRFLGGLVAYAKNKGYAMGWCSHAYKDRYGVWPDWGVCDGSVSSVPPDVMSFIKHRMIKQRHSKWFPRRSSKGMISKGDAAFLLGAIGRSK